MNTTIEVIWWIGLLGALPPTLIIVKEVVLLLRVLTDIHTLGVYTRNAARGIAGNVAVAPQLSAAAEASERVGQRIDAIVKKL